MAENIPVIDRDVRIQEILNDPAERVNLQEICTMISGYGGNSPNTDEEFTAALETLFEILLSAPGVGKLYPLETAREQFAEDNPGGVMRVLVRF
jgi:hypothetical protein